MKRVLSLLLLIPFLSTQVLFVTPAFARGPYDKEIGQNQEALVGTYGVALMGDYQWQASTNPDGQTNASKVNASNVTGVMAMSIPLTGMVVGRVLLFKEGLMYAGLAQGVTDLRNGTVHLLSQVSHYFLRTGTDGVLASQSLATVDSQYSGQIDLHLKLDYFSGIIEATGDARFSEYNPYMSSTSTFGQSVPITASSLNSTVTAILGPGSSLGNQTSGTLKFSNDIPNSNLAAVTFNGGTTYTVSNGNASPITQTSVTTFYNNATQRSADISGKAKQLELYMTASGVRQSTSTSTLNIFTIPSDKTSFQFEVPATAN